MVDCKVDCFISFQVSYDIVSIEEYICKKKSYKRFFSFFPIRNREYYLIFIYTRTFFFQILTKKGYFLKTMFIKKNYKMLNLSYNYYFELIFYSSFYSTLLAI